MYRHRDQRRSQRRIPTSRRIPTPGPGEFTVKSLQINQFVSSSWEWPARGKQLLSRGDNSNSNDATLTTRNVTKPRLNLSLPQVDESPLFSRDASLRDEPGSGLQRGALPSKHRHPGHSQLQTRYLVIINSWENHFRPDFHFKRTPVCL